MNSVLRITKYAIRNDVIHKILTCIVGWTFAHMSFAIPVNRLRETDTLMAFYHPKPEFPFHVILVPKRQVATLKDLDPNDAAFLHDLYSTVQNLVEEFHLSAYRLIVNGGDYQEFPHLHFHLVGATDQSPLPE